MYTYIHMYVYIYIYLSLFFVYSFVLFINSLFTCIYMFLVPFPWVIIVFHGKTRRESKDIGVERQPWSGLADPPRRPKCAELGSCCFQWGFPGFRV